MPDIIETQPQLYCKSIYQIANLLAPPSKYSVISSKLWNEIVQDLYLTYNVFEYINYLTQYQYLRIIPSIINIFYNSDQFFKPYEFTSILYAKKGISLTVDDFNKLIDAIIELANKNNIKLQKRLSHVQHDQIVKSEQFSDIVYDINQFITFNYNQYFLLDCNGYKFSNLLNSIKTFLTVLINELKTSITVLTNTYIKNFLINNNNQTINIFGSIDKFLINKNYEIITIDDNASINILKVGVNTLIITINNNAYINTLHVEVNFGSIIINNNSNINTLRINDNADTIQINDNVTIKNFICGINTGNVIISPNAKIINNQCTKS